MPTRRETLMALGTASVGSAAITTSAFDTAFAQPGADLRIIPDPRGPPDGIKLLPGRQDETFVETTEDGLVAAIVLNGVGVPGAGLNKAAETRFENLVAIRNEPPGQPIEELYFEFEVTDEGLDNADPTTGEIESVLFIASAGGDIRGDGDHDFLTTTDHGQNGADKLAPNEEIPFGIGVDLRMNSVIQDLPPADDYGVKLLIEAKRNG